MYKWDSVTVVCDIIKVDIMPKFLLRKRPFFDDENEYNEQVDNLKKKVVRFPVFVITGLVLVVLVVLRLNINIFNNCNNIHLNR